MSKPLIRFVRLHCKSAGARAERHRDGVVAVAAIKEDADLARLLLADMGRWQRNHGTSVTNGIESYSREAHLALIAGFGIAMHETQIVEMDASGHFDLWCTTAPGARREHRPLEANGRHTASRSHAAFIEWAGDAGAAMWRVAEHVGAGEWVGVEG